MTAQATEQFIQQGGCACGHVRYEVIAEPLYVHCCHCTWCQRESGAAFALNAMVESNCINLLKTPPILIDTPSESGQGQKIARCPQCQVALWSHYGGLGELLSFIKVGTLDDPDTMPPDIHIFTQSKQDWIRLPADGLIFERYYNRKELWPESSLTRFNALLEQRQ